MPVSSKTDSGLVCSGVRDSTEVVVFIFGTLCELGVCSGVKDSTEVIVFIFGTLCGLVVCSGVKDSTECLCGVCEEYCKIGGFIVSTAKEKLKEQDRCCKEDQNCLNDKIEASDVVRHFSWNVVGGFGFGIGCNRTK